MPEEHWIELEVLNGPMDGHIFSLTEDKISMGRNLENDISIPHDKKIRKTSHVVFTASGDNQWHLTNNAKRRLHVNGNRVTGDIRIVVGQLIKVGNTILVVNEFGSAQDKREKDEQAAKASAAKKNSGTIPVHRI